MVKNQITKMTLDYLITCKIYKPTQTEKLDISFLKHFQKLNFSFESSQFESKMKKG